MAPERTPTDAASREPDDELLSPATTAVVTMELQRGVVGDLATMPALAEAATSRDVLARAGQLVGAARAAGLTVVHARVAWRADRRGTPATTPLIAALSRRAEHLLEGTPAVDPVAELGDTSADLVSWRRHGLTPFTGTDLDLQLRASGIDTVVAAGVSLNVGVLGMCLSAADLGYQVVVATDAVVGIPVEYGDAVLANSLAGVASMRTVDELAAAWSAQQR